MPKIADPLSDIRREKFREFCRRKGWVNPNGSWPSTAIGKECGRPAGQISNLLNGIASFGGAIAREIEDSLQHKGMQRYYLDGRDAGASDDNEWIHIGSFDHGESTSDISLKKNVTTEDVVSIFQFSTGGSMGGGLILRDQPGVIKKLDVSGEWARKNIKDYTSLSNLRLVTGFGDSMRPMFNSGDPLLLDAGVTEVKYDAIYFFRVEDEGFIKRLQRIPGEGILALSENKAYRDWVIKPEMNFQVFGRVLKAWCGCDY